MIAKNKPSKHVQFKDILNYFDEGDYLFATTQSISALFYGEKRKTCQNQSILTRRIRPRKPFCDVFSRPCRSKIRIGNKLYFGEDDSLVAEDIDNTTSRGRTLRFLFDGEHEGFKAKLKELGSTPVPDDIQKHRDITPEDEQYYQTIYAKNEGAVVAPAAGFHFSRELNKRLVLKGVDFTEITLHALLLNFL